MKRESVTFTPQMVTVFLEHEKLISKVLKRCHDLTATEFCILREIYLAGGRVEGMDFAGFLMLKRNSISMAITSLSRKGYVVKETGSSDRRMTVVSETAAGKKVTQDATRNVYEAQVSTFWKSLTVEEERGGNRCAVLVLEKLRDHAIDDAATLKAINTPISPEFIVFCKVVPQRWATIIKESADLSLTEFRILNNVASSPDGRRASDTARSLLLERSLVSTCKHRLIMGSLMGETADPDDGRNAILRSTAAGEAVVMRLNALLTKATADMYSLCDDDLCVAANEWHARMYRNMNVMYQMI